MYVGNAEGRSETEFISKVFVKLYFSPPTHWAISGFRCVRAQYYIRDINSTYSNFFSKLRYKLYTMKWTELKCTVSSFFGKCNPYLIPLEHFQHSRKFLHSFQVVSIFLTKSKYYYSLLLPIWGFHVTGVIRCIFLCVWLPLFSLFLRFTEVVVACITVLFFTFYFYYYHVYILLFMDIRTVSNLRLLWVKLL